MEEKLGTGPIDKGRIKKLSIIIVVAFFATMSLWGNDYFINLFSLLFLYMALGQMWNLLAGYSGLISLGQQIFVGIGGYSIAVMTEKLGQGVFLSFLAAIGVSVAFAFVISFPIFKMRGIYFTIGTWIIAEALSVYFVNWSFVNYAIGFNIRIGYSFSPRIIYFMALLIGIGAVAIVYFLLRSKTGLALMAIRDNTNSAEVRGVKIYQTKLKIFLLTSGYTALIGAVLYLNFVYIVPRAAFAIDWTVIMVFIVIIGGIGTIEGPIIGAVAYIFIRQYLYNFPGISLIILGIVAVVIILAIPKGIMGTLHARFGFELFSVRRGFVDSQGKSLSLKDILLGQNNETVKKGTDD